MDIPNNGSVIVIDDVISEALPLMKALAKKSIPSIYYSGSVKEFPAEPMTGIRIIFLDMKLVNVMDEKNISSTLLSILSKIISVNNGPYVLILWSKHDNIYLDDFKEKLFSSKEIPTPVGILNMNKAEYFPAAVVPGNDVIDEVCSTLELENIKLSNNIVGKLKDKIYNDSQVSAGHKLPEGDIEKIERKLYEELQKVSIFDILLLWENEVKKSSVNTVNQFSSIEPVDRNWSNNMKLLFNRIAMANAGKDNIKGSADIIKSSFSTFKNTLFDNIDLSLISNSCLKEYINEDDVQKLEILMERHNESSTCKYILKEDGKNYIPSKIDLNNGKEYDLKQYKKCNYPFKIQDARSEDEKFVSSMINDYVEYISKVNSRILLGNANDTVKQPGNVYFTPSEKNEDEKDKRELLMKSCFVKKEDLDKINSDKIKYIELEISPECDYAQNKWALNRILPGLLVTSDYFSLIKKDADYIYTTPFLLVDNFGVVKLIFDFKFFTSHKLDYFNDKELLTKFSKPLLTQIKNKLGFQIIRGGIINL